MATLCHFEVKNKQKLAKQWPRRWSQLCSPNNQLNPKNLHHVKSDQSSHATTVGNSGKNIIVKIECNSIVEMSPLNQEQSSLRLERCFDPNIAKFGLFWGLHFRTEPPGMFLTTPFMTSHGGALCGGDESITGLQLVSGSEMHISTHPQEY